MKLIRITVSFVLAISTFVIFSNPQVSNAVVGWVGAAGSPYIGSAASQPMDINVSRNATYSTNRWNRYFAIDSKGFPHVVWVEYGVYTVHYLKWNGIEWVNVNNIPYNPSTLNSMISSSGDCPQLVLDNLDYPHIVFHGGQTWFTDIEVTYIRWDGSNWVNSFGVVYNGVNGNISNDNVDSVNPGLVIDNQNHPHIVWLDENNDDVIYIHFDGNNWLNANGLVYDPLTNNGHISKNMGECHYPFINISSSNKIGIVWETDIGSNYDIFYVEIKNNQVQNVYGILYNGMNANVSNDTFLNFDQSADLSFDNNGNPCILWQAYGDVYCIIWNGSNWLTINGNLYVPNSGNANITQTSGLSESSTASFDSDNLPHFAWSDTTYGNREICYMKWNGSTFVNAYNEVYSPISGNAIVSNNTGSSYNPHLELNNLGLPYLLWSDDTSGNNEIYFVQFANSFDGTFDISKTVDTNGDGDFTDSGKTVNAGDTLTYKINWQFAQGQDPLENPYLYDTVPDGTTYVAGSASPNANISYSLDGGATWIAGEPPNGSPAGTQLRWDLSSLWVGAAGSPYIGSAPTQPMDINVSRTVSQSGYNVALTGQASERIKIDSKGYPNIVWVESIAGNWDICYVRWNGSNWVNIQGLIYNPVLYNANVSNTVTMSIFPELALDSNDYPNICWSEGTSMNTTDVWFVKWNGTSWVNVNNSIYAPLTNNANISNNSGWSNFPTIRLNKNNQPHIAWDDFSYAGYSREIMYVRWDGANWLNVQGTIFDPITGNAKVSQNGGASCDPSIALDINGNPYLAWDDYSYGPVRFILIHWDGAKWISIDGIPFDSAIGNANIGGAGNSPKVRLGNDGYPRVCWPQLIGDFEICYIRWDGSKWVNIYNNVYNPITNNHNISNDANDSWLGNFELDNQDNPHFIWQNAIPTNDEVMYVFWNGNNLITANGSQYDPLTTNANISKNSGISRSPSIAIDNINNPHIVWLDNTLGNDEIFYVTKSNDKDFSFSVKVDNPPTSPAFCNKATFRHKWDNGTAIESNEVCNTINYNFTGTFTLGKGVDTNGDGIYADSGKTVDPGAKLSYKIDWSFDNPNNDPLFGAYVYDTITLGTTYVAGSAPTYNLSYSTNGGSTWIAGEPPDGSPAGTRLRWKLSQPGWTNAKGQLVNSTNPNVSNNTGVSDFPSLAINKNGDPCIAWSDDVSGATLVYYARWNGSQWVNAAGLPFTVANGSTAGIRGGDPSLALDPVTGNPWIAFQSNAILFSNLEIHILRWNGAQWTNAAGIAATLLNTNVSNNTGLSWFPSHQLALDSNGYPCFVWKDNSTGSWQSYFARWNGISWTNVLGAVLTATNGSIGNGIVDPSFWPTLVLDENDYPCIAWDSTIAGNSEVCFARWNGTQWVNSFGTPLTPSNCNISNNSGSSVIPYLAMDKLTHNPCIVWSDDTSGNYEIYFAKWNGSAWVNANGTMLNATNANMSFTSGLSSLLSIAIDGNNLPAVTWEDDTTGNSEIYYAKWNGSSWVNAKGDAFTAANGIINTSPARSWFPSLAFDPVTNNPNIAWLDRTPGSNEVYFARWTDFKQSFTFSVKIDKPFTNPALSPICNTASFAHVFDNGIPVVSNSACVSVKGIETKKEAVLTITKTSKSFQYWPKDTFEFTITVKNTGQSKATDVVVSDLFPKELDFVSSIPSGLAGHSTVKFQFGDFNPGRVEVIKLKFRLNPKLEVQDCIMVTNEAIASSGGTTVKDLAVFKVCAPKAPCPLYFETIWSGLVDNVGKTNQEIKASIRPSCGSSPYTVSVDWGDGSKSNGIIKDSSEFFLASHSYASVGEYRVTVTVSDAYMSTRTVAKSVKIE